MRLGIGQYVVLVPLTTLITVISQALGDYCLGSYSPKFTHVWMSAIASISVTVAMFCVVRLSSLLGILDWHPTGYFS